jgi:hypothetical protein
VIGRTVVFRHRQVGRERVYVVASGHEPNATARVRERSRRYTRNGMIRSATMFATLIIGLIAGPAVSL